MSTIAICLSLIHIYTDTAPSRQAHFFFHIRCRPEQWLTKLSQESEDVYKRPPGDWSPEHYHRYFLARELVEGKRVLDIASGEGYGSAILAQLAKHVTGVDISQEAVDAARDKYQKNNLDYVCGSVTAIPLPDHSVDMVVSFETIEHLTEQTEMLAEIRRVLIPEGILVISSPDKLTYSDIPVYHNEVHVK